MRRTGVEGNTMIKPGGAISHLEKLGNHFKAKVDALRSFEQILVEHAGYEAVSIGT